VDCTVKKSGKLDLNVAVLVSPGISPIAVVHRIKLADYRLPAQVLLSWFL